MKDQYTNPYGWNQKSPLNSNCSDRNVLANMQFSTNMNPNNTMMMPNNNMGGFPNMNNQNLANPLQGYIQGNLFNNLYTPYKNYRPMRLVPNNEQAELLLNANQLLFASHELRLYLDVHPDDTNMINLFNQYRAGANEAVKVYEQKYGPITWDALSNTNMFSWEATAWPWEMGVM